MRQCHHDSTPPAAPESQLGRPRPSLVRRYTRLFRPAMRLRETDLSFGECGSLLQLYTFAGAVSIVESFASWTQSGAINIAVHQTGRLDIRKSPRSLIHGWWKFVAKRARTKAGLKPTTTTLKYSVGLT